MLNKIEWYKDIKALVMSDWFIAYTNYLKSLEKLYINSILKLDKSKSEKQYTEHDINRKILEVIRWIKESPLTALNEIRTSVQEDLESTEKILKVIKHTNNILGIE